MATTENVSLVPMEGDYPFGAFHSRDPSVTRVMVHQAIPCTEINRQQIMEKVKTLITPKLKETCLVFIEGVIEDPDCINVLYEYVPIAAKYKLRVASQELLQKTKENLRKLAAVLSEFHIVGDFKI